MATAPSSYYTAYSDMVQQTWTPVAHPANTYGNSLPWTSAATNGSGAAAANQGASIQRTGQISGYTSLNAQGQQAVAAQGATVDLEDAVNATSLQTIGTVRTNAPQRECGCRLRRSPDPDNRVTGISIAIAACGPSASATQSAL